MPTRLCCALLSLSLSVAIVAGCKPKRATGSDYFQTPFQSECQFIVESIASDLAEQIYFAANRRLPDPKRFSVSATEKPGSAQDAPVYKLEVSQGQQPAGLQLEVAVNGLIWSPEVYEELASALARASGLSPGTTRAPGDTAHLSSLLEATPEAIEQDNQDVSQRLEKDFANPELHERAALLLGVFLLRDASGSFFDLRSPLCRITAHLAMARYLSGSNPPGVNGCLARAILLTLVNAQAPALQSLDSLPANDSAVESLARALRARNTGDFRPLLKLANGSRLEGVACFSQMADYADTAGAWSRLDEGQRRTIDYIRAANQQDFSVEMGHELLQKSVPLELREIGTVYQLAQHRELERTALAAALNEMPERSFSQGPGQEVHVRIIGWGQWALFLQRHLGHAIQRNFDFLYRKWGARDEARQFAAECAREYGGLRLYPFVRRFICTDAETYRKSVDDGLKVTVAAPHLVPAECWNYLVYAVKFAPLYLPNPNPHINEWHQHNPPPGTVYDLHPRLNHPSLVGRPDAAARFEQLHQLAPHDGRIASWLLEQKHKGRATYDQAMALFRPVLPYSIFALRTVASTVADQPDRYEELMLQAAELNPSCFYDLAEYAFGRKQDDQAAQYLEKASSRDLDSVRVANYAEWRVNYYLKQKQTDKAHQIADFAGEVYSARGLRAKANFFEGTTNYTEAFNWFAKIEERYDDSAPLAAFCVRYRAATGDKKYAEEVGKRLKSLFPKGLEKVSLGSFRAAPTNGVVILQQSDLLLSTGLKQGDVIVALQGLRVHNLIQFSYARDYLDSPELNLIAWQGEGYRQIKCSPPNRRFGVQMAEYRPTQAKGDAP